MSMHLAESPFQSGPCLRNISEMLQRNFMRFPEQVVLFDKRSGIYEGHTWSEMYRNILNIAFNLRKNGFDIGDKMVIFSANRLEMLELELAVMASGGICIPIFAYFHQETAELLINHSDAKFLAVEGELQLSRLANIPKIEQIYIFDKDENNLAFDCKSYSDLLIPRDIEFKLHESAAPDEICLNMYTSGTMGIPKCVQLSHKNILSQQAALSSVWDLNSNDRFLSYLPWHHSFGGIFELFSAIYNGSTIFLESGKGKDPDIIMQNWKDVRPTIFFSVPKVYQSLVELTKRDKEAEDLFFHSQLKFIFTAAAPLPRQLSDEFEKRNIPVIEGWGLTETSPCCTLTDPHMKRQSGVVGKPLPGVSIRLADDNEIQVKGPNVMKGYYKNDLANDGIFTDDGWFCTGDIGEITESGLKLVSRKDRIFKLSNGEKVIPTDLEKLIEGKCHYISFAMVVGSGQEYPVALLFPNKKLLEKPDYLIAPEDGCFCPRNLSELKKCLHGCLHDANCGIGQKFARIKAAMLIDDELSLENGTLTSSMKAASAGILNVYRANLEFMYDDDAMQYDDVYLIRLDHKMEQPARKISN